MLIPEGGSCFELEIKKSRFISEVTPAGSPAEAREILKSKRREHPDAAHVVHAFITGAERQHMGMSDDGEPSGTSGKPALEVLKGRGVTNLMLTIVRYFGGTKLGTGGLVRAYSEAARGALDRLKTVPLVTYTSFRIKADYSFYQPLSATAGIHECRIETESFGTAVEIEGLVPEEKADAFKAAVTSLSSGRAEINVGSENQTVILE
ncbi:MAG: YigZ family protein [Spirochaetales bacterium]|nr:YigZ family protein [Spirochaetales bacterium]